MTPPPRPRRRLIWRIAAALAVLDATPGLEDLGMGAGRISVDDKRMINCRSDLNQLVREAVHFLERESREYDITLQLELTAVPVAVDVDGVQIEQVILNLVRNGFDAISLTRTRSRAQMASSAPPVVGRQLFIRAIMSATASNGSSSSSTLLMGAIGSLECSTPAIGRFFFISEAHA